MGTLKVEFELQKRINDKAIRDLMDSLDVKLKNIRKTYDSTGQPPMWMLSFTHDSVALMNMMSFASQCKSIESKVDKRELPRPPKRLTMLGGMKGIRHENE